MRPRMVFYCKVIDLAALAPAPLMTYPKLRTVRGNLCSFTFSWRMSDHSRQIAALGIGPRWSTSFRFDVVLCHIAIPLIPSLTASTITIRLGTGIHVPSLIVLALNDDPSHLTTSRLSSLPVSLLGPSLPFALCAIFYLQLLRPEGTGRSLE